MTTILTYIGIFSVKMTSTEDVESLFQKFDTRKNQSGLKVPPRFKKASVLIPLFKKNGDWYVLLTLRSKHLSSHADTVSFPGGREDEQDHDEVSTALREAQEEVGLNPEDVRIIATLPASFVRPNNIVTPVLGIIPDDFVANPHDGEVQKVFSLPLSRFLNEDYQCKRSIFSFAEGHKIVIFHFDDCIEGENVTTWGFTSALCIRVAMVIFQSPVKHEFFVGEPITKDTAFDKDQAFTSALLKNYTPKL